MLKVMIVDDENLFREALKKTVPWEELGFEMCCEAENGYDALEKIAQYKPDIALVDINMPMMNGLELAAEIKESGLDIRVIIITGYGEFNYARQAIEVGVENYLLKPIDENQLIKVLSSVKKQIEIKIEELKKQVTVYKPLLKEMLLNSLLQGTRLIQHEELGKLKESLSIDPDTQPYHAVVIELGEKDEYCWNDDERQLWIFAVSNVVSEIFGNDCVFEQCQDIHGRICALVHMKATDMEWQQNVTNLCDRIRFAVQKYLKLTVTIGVSNAHQGMGFISQAYNEALYALKNKLIMGENKVIFYGNLEESDITAINIYPIEQKKQLLMAARMNELEEVNSIIRSIFNDIRLSNTPSELITVKCIELISTCLEFLAGTGNGAKNIFGDNFNIFDEIQNKKTVEDMEARIREIFTKAINSVHLNKIRKFSKTVEDAKKYIHENYNRFDLKIDDIAKNVYVRYGYLCMLFKRETGRTINDYITEYRIKKAKELIDAGCNSVSAASSRVGYADANYFSKCFKKIYGITPSRYIDNRLGGQ